MQLDNNGNTLEVLQHAVFNTAYENVYPSLAIDPQSNCYIAYYSINPGLGAGQAVASQDLFVFKMSTLVCVIGKTQILMMDGVTKPINTLQRGDWVAPNHQVARVCRETIDPFSKIDLLIFEKYCLGNQPEQTLIVTPNHPIVYRNARRPAKCFAKCPGVTFLENVPVTQILTLLEEACLYDLQFEHDGTYIANGLEIQSRSPYSYFGPLPKELYFDQSLYCSDRVWDSLDHPLPLDMTPLNFNVVMLKNKQHNIEKKTTNLIIYKDKQYTSIESRCLITKYVT
jgi:hypothetical protein